MANLRPLAVVAPLPQVELPEGVRSCLAREPDPARHLTCPIDLTLFVDPVYTADGHAYERSAITTWLREHSTSPVTGLVLEHKRLTPAVAVRQAVAAWLDEHKGVVLPSDVAITMTPAGVLGRGRYCIVRAAVHRTPTGYTRNVAVKLFPQSDLQLSRRRYELESAYLTVRCFV